MENREKHIGEQPEELLDSVLQGMDAMLSDLEGSIGGLSAANGAQQQEQTFAEEPAPEQAEPEAPADALEMTQKAAPETPAEDSEADAPAEMQPEDALSEETETPDGQEEPDDEELLPDISAEPLADDADAEVDETAGMTLLERARYHARMRRREQTRLRRENARRGSAGQEPIRQAMTAMDIRFTLFRLGIAMALLLLGRFIPLDKLSFVFYLIAYLIVAVPVVAAITRDITHGRYMNESLLVFLASFGAFLLGRRAEAGIVLILYTLGKIVCELVFRPTGRTLSQQTDFSPEKASVVNMSGEERQVAPSEVQPGDFIVVRDGERVPIDGVVLRGEGSVDDTVVTGEMEPAAVEKNSYVLAGSLYTGSLLLIRATARFEDCAVNQITHIQEESVGRRAALEQRAVDGASRIIPIVVVAALLLAVIPPLFRSNTSIASWIYRALTIIVICSPAALQISVPLCFMSGRARLAQKGIHMKGSEAIEKMAELRMVVFDKTGTLTEGELHVKEVLTTPDFPRESCLALAAAAEQLSHHPVARAVVAACPSAPQKISEFEEFPGRGVRARIGNHNLLVGNRKLMVSRGVKGVPEVRGTVVYVAYEGDYAGAIVLEDIVRPEAAEAISGLKSQGVLRTVMLTGDTELPAQQTAEAVGIDTVHYGLQPEEKASKMEFLLRTIPTDGTAAYVGDGINDIEELKLADVGVGMGVAGSLRSADAASVLIMTNNLNRLCDALRICRRTHSIAFQNMVIVMLFKLALALLTVLGVTAMWQTIAADVLITVLTVLNAARIQGIK